MSDNHSIEQKTLPAIAIAEEIHLLCRRYQALALHSDGEILTIALSSEAPKALLAALRFASGQTINVEQWPAARLEQKWEQRTASTAESLLTQESSLGESASAYLNEEDDTPVVQFINQTLRQALQRRASDIHFEPYHHHYRIRLRIDGVLQILPSPSPALTPRISARLKIMAQLNIAERRLPQDGQLTLTLDNTQHTMRISTLPTLYGEKIVLRILQLQAQDLPLEQLGLSENALEHYTQALAKPQGLILVTGPTGSGKTITLYAGLRRLNQTQRNICSVEDPIEIPVHGINQTPINLKADLDFARVLRSLLRQDPDVIMIGEIRDVDTAEIAIKAAQTGHLVLSTLHTNSSAETLTRLTQMGIPGYLIASCLQLAIAQRLVRRLCLHCRYLLDTPVTLPSHLWPVPLPVWRARGCEQCFSGYYGRVGIYETLAVTPEIQQALIQNLPTRQLADIARQQGQKTLLDVGLSLVAQGVTSLEEMYRVIGGDTTIKSESVSISETSPAPPPLQQREEFAS